MDSKNTQRGQALVLILLSLSVVLTIVLFVLSRSVTDIVTSTEQADSVRAFSAAEAGVETALITGAGSGGSVPIGNASYNVEVSDYAEGGQTFNYPLPILSGDIMTLWLTSHQTDGTLYCGSGFPCFRGNTIKFCWGNAGTASGTSTTPAAIIEVYYETTPGNLSTIRVARAVFDPNTTRRSSNQFAAPDSGTCSIDGKTYAFQKTLTMSGLGIPAGSYNVANGLLFARLTMVYNTSGHAAGASVAFAGDSTLPSQGVQVSSTGTSGAAGAQSNRKVSVFQGWPEFILPGASIYSPTGVTK